MVESEKYRKAVVYLVKYTPPLNVNLGFFLVLPMQFKVKLV